MVYLSGHICQANWGLGKDAEIPGTRNCFSPVVDIQFTVDTGCVRFYSAWGNNELPGDFFVSFAQGDDMENFQLAL